MKEGKTADRSRRFREKLRRSISEYGRWISENADALVPEIDGLGSLSIEVTFDSEDPYPQIKVQTKHISRAMLEEMFRGGEGSVEE